VSIESFTVKGMPWSGPSSSPARTAASAFLAASSAVGDGHDRVHLRIDRLDAVEVRLDQLDGRDFLGTDQFGQLAGVGKEDVVVQIMSAM
jgi:hypothetical protein